MMVLAIWGASHWEGRLFQGGVTKETAGCFSTGTGLHTHNPVATLQVRHLDHLSEMPSNAYFSLIMEEH